MKASWRTTMAGLLTIVSAAITLVAQPLLDDNPATEPNWSAFLPLLMSGLVGLMARDNKVTSEQAGAK